MKTTIERGSPLVVPLHLSPAPQRFLLARTTESPSWFDTTHQLKGLMSNGAFLSTPINNAFWETQSEFSIIKTTVARQRTTIWTSCLQETFTYISLASRRRKRRSTTLLHYAVLFEIRGQYNHGMLPLMIIEKNSNFGSLSCRQ